jgi:hypothetical protein
MVGKNGNCFKPRFLRKGVPFEYAISLWGALGDYAVHMLIYQEQTNINKLLIGKNR